ncbi:Kazal-type serine protease inhibitor family protein [Bradyrhizobium sp.]|uniref:Kazal-type serine protease inhibitor family protein n=1 Tax=Bradyrhizobium sp. TaxID=376 RepID=UPI00261683D7|nr:Kazal-type serine protease inhibitor family protein [Bradyrhizobium sp.]
MRLHLGSFAATFVVMFGLQAASAAVIANLDEACGGPDKITCNSALYCQLPAGQCSAPDAAGTCVKAPDFCMRVSRPVCGCNGKTYLNECEARHAKMAIDHTGACKKPPATEGAPAAKPAAKKKKKPAKGTKKAKPGS